MCSTIVVTGGTRGIGRSLVEALARHPTRPDVVLTARDPTRADSLVRALTEAGAAPPRVVLGNLASVAGARALAAGLEAACPRVDVLVHNAGVWPTRRLLGPEGWEQAFVTNHLAPFALTRALVPHMPAGARIVQVTAGLYPLGRYDAQRTPRGDDFSRVRTYATTKLANLLATRRWAELLRERAIDVHAVHPGVVRTHLGASSSPLGWLLALAKLAWASPATGALGPLRLATDPALAGQTDRFWDRLSEAPWRRPATDLALARAVWEQAEALVGPP